MNIFFCTTGFYPKNISTFALPKNNEYKDMITAFHHTKSEIEKLANSIIYLCNSIADPNKTKILKLIYFLQEKSIQTHGVPFFKIPFKVWQFGPVNPDLYQELNGRTFILDGYISTYNEGETTLVKPLKDFNDDEFSDREIELLDKITKAFRDTPASKLVDLTHYEGQPWHRTAAANNLLKAFEEKRLSTTDVDIDFTSLINDDEVKTSRYESYLEFLEASSALKV